MLSDIFGQCLIRTTGWGGGKALKGSLVEVNHCRSLQTLTLLKKKIVHFHYPV